MSFVRDGAAADDAAAGVFAVCGAPGPSGAEHASAAVSAHAAIEILWVMKELLVEGWATRRAVASDVPATRQGISISIE
jgi:hypothetical protein